ncbi:helix-turn-helix domain-containing protein [Halobellus litoreus]|uniref:Helix-turn-helix domain-containing protein n=1 Tax=Halobellus litoreus TaxID=755310 RepID=A0ABD6DWI8_9EURY
MSGIRAEITVDSPPDCPAATAAAAADGTAKSITKSVPTDPDEAVTEEFVLTGDRPIDATGTKGGDGTSGDAAPSVDELQEVFSYGSERVYRFERPQGRTCFCECIEGFGCPVRDVHSRGGSLTVSFHAPDVDTLRSVVARLDQRWSGVSVRRLVRSDADRDGSDLVLVDRGELTERQREVLETAHEMGYFEHPKRANAGDVAAELGVDDSTFVEHLSAAQGKLLSSILP